MNITKLKTYALSIAGTLLINGCLLLSATAQSIQTTASVDDASLLSKIEQQAAAAMHNKEWAIANCYEKDQKNLQMVIKSTIPVKTIKKLFI